MLDKYQHFKKISKTEGCSFYNAEDRTSMQDVLMKRLQQKCTWDQLLNNRNVQYLSKAKFAPKMIEIFKKKSYYFIVFQKPTGPPISQPEQIGKFSLNKFYPMFNELCENCIKLKEHSPQMYILPQWVFIHRNSCKIAHFQPFISTQENQGGKHVFMYNLQKSKMENSLKNINDSDTFSFERKQSLVFNLGTIAYQLLTGLKATSAVQQQQYRSQLRILEQNAYRRIFKETQDEKLSELIVKMIKQDPFDSPTITSVHNFIKRKAKLYEPKLTNNLTLSLQLEKIKLKDANMTKNDKKFTRACCKTMENQQVEVEVEKKGNLTVAYMRKSQRFANRSFLPEIPYSQKRRFVHQSKNKSHLTNFSKPTMLTSQRTVGMKQLIS